MILPYIINTALILATCLVFYKLLLRRETFYRVNRYMLITCLAISFALPLLQVPQKFSLRKDRETSDVKRETSPDSYRDVNRKLLYAQDSSLTTHYSPLTTHYSPLTTHS